MIMSNLYIPVCGLFCAILIFIIFFTKKRVQNNETMLFSGMVITSLIDSIIMVLIIFLAYKIDIDKISVPLKILNKVDYIQFVLWVWLLFLYIYQNAVKETTKITNKFNKTLKITGFLNLVLLTIMICLPVHLYSIDNVMYSYGPSANLLYGICAFYLLLSIIVMISNSKKIFNRKYLPFFVFIIMACLVMWLRQVNPGLVIVSAVLAYINLIMCFTIENPDIKLVEQMELAKETADKANAAKTDFLSSMSHEIRTPLNAIVGFSDCIKYSDNLNDAKDNAKDIIEASNTLLEIVNGILDISKIESGKLEIINSNYNAPKLFNNLAKLVTPKMSEKGLDFQVTIAPDIPNVLYGDSANVKKVVTNLLSNAYKYTDSGYVKYDVKCVNVDGICRLIISVQDSGRGIKKESISKLFNKFQRVDEDRNTTIEGTGLGLAITKQLVELMGGNIVVDSVYGEGSKFTITLDQRIENVGEVEEKKEVIDTIDLAGKRILVVDDNSINLKVAKKLLEIFNATVEVCDSGLKCIKLINSGESFDIILMDDMMPKMSGTQTLHKLKEDSTFNIPVIALTANAITGMKEKYLNAGFNDYLAKPIEKEEMIEIFAKIFKNDIKVKKGENKVVEKTKSSEKNTDNKKNTKNKKRNSFKKNVDYLKSNNIDVDHGLELLGDIDFYNDTMARFIEELNKHLISLEKYKKSSDMPNYAILVHGIKSDCKYLGIMELADITYEHELKSKANDVEFVNDNYDNLIKVIKHYLKICEKYIGRD